MIKKTSIVRIPSLPIEANISQQSARQSQSASQTSRTPNLKSAWQTRLIPSSPNLNSAAQTPRESCPTSPRAMTKIFDVCVDEPSVKVDLSKSRKTDLSKSRKKKKRGT